jgi:hypothetical protein
MNETAHAIQHMGQFIQETSEDMVWEASGYLVVETALEATAYALGDR